MRITKRMTAEEAARYFERVARRVPQELRRAEADNLVDAFSEARALSSGGIPARELAQLGHPYRRGGAPPADPAIINRQTGLFFASWEMSGPHGFANGGAAGFRSTLENTAPYAGYLAKGTRRMISRPLIARLEERIGDRVTARRRLAIRRAVGG